jgi:transposase
MRYALKDYEWRVLQPMLPNKPRGVPRVDDRRILNGIFWVLRSGAPGAIYRRAADSRARRPAPCRRWFNGGPRAAPSCTPLFCR